MSARILKIPGRSPEARRARLQSVSAWMVGAGWRLVDYADWEASALFERPEEAASLPWLHPTRWLPGPRPWHPGQWIATVQADPRLVALPGAAACVALVLLAALLSPSSFDPQQLRGQAATEQWYSVTASQLNVREKPDERAQVVGVLYRNQRVRVEGEVTAEWVRIGAPERGYVARAYLAAADASDESEH